MFKQLHYRFPAYSFLKICAIIILSMMMVFNTHAQSDSSFLAPEEAFQFSSKMRDEKNIEVTFVIANEYHMYRERFSFQANDATLGKPVYPPAELKFDEAFQKDLEIYHHTIKIIIPVEARDKFTLRVTSQGCSVKGLCYPPMISIAHLSVPKITKQNSKPVITSTIPAPQAITLSSQFASIGSLPSNMGRIESLLQSRHLISIVLLFLFLGLALSFTPCVLPMVPILSAIIVDNGESITRARSFSLSLVYSLGVVIVYTSLGIVTGLIGQGLATALREPAVLISFSVILIGLALSMFNVYLIRIPTIAHTKLTQLLQQQATGKFIGTFIMGAISACIVSPCIAPPLAGVLLYLSQTQDVVIGGSALFAMSIGMSVPLLLTGACADKLLPRAGAWMETIKHFFGVLILALALWMITPLLPTWIILFLAATLCLAYGVHLLHQRINKISAVIGVIFSLIGLIQLINVATGGRDALTPLSHLRTNPAPTLTFINIDSVDALNKAIASSQGKIIMLDFYADWCVSCKEMEKLTFTNPRVREQLSNMVLLRADITKNNLQNKKLLKHFHLFGPPAMLFFDATGKELSDKRVIGYQNAPRFLTSLSTILIDDGTNK